MLDLDTGQMKWTIDLTTAGTCRGFSFLDSMNVLLLHAAKPGDQNAGSVMALDLTTGRPLWSRSDFFAGCEPFCWKDGSSAVGRVAPVLDSAGNLIVFWGKEQLRKHDGRTGELLWKSARIKGGERAPDALHSSRAGDVLLVVWGGGEVIQGFDPGNGAPLWPRRFFYIGYNLRQVEATDRGFLIHRTSDGTTFVIDPLNPKKGKDMRHISSHVDLVDARTGKRQWSLGESETVEDSDTRVWGTKPVIHGDRVMLAFGSTLHWADVQDGKKSHRARLKFERVDDLVSLEWMDGRMLVVGSRSMSWFDVNGSRVQSVHHMPPSQGLFSYLLSEVALGVASRALGASHRPSWPESYAWSSSLANHVFMLTEARGQLETLKIRKSDGTTVGTVPVGGGKCQVASDGSGMFAPRSGKEFAYYKF